LRDALIEALADHVSKQMKTPHMYPCYCSIVQSSGMGKSRLVDEFSKDHFLIPINLREEVTRGASRPFCFTFMVFYTRHLGFPPADDAVRNFLTPCDTEEMQGQFYSRACHFLLSLFKHTKNKIISLGGNNRKDRIMRFREYMTKGQTFGRVGNDRRIFYNAVVADAQKVR
jgi:hypothetical protein